MPLAILHSRSLRGIHATPISIEVHISGGLPKVRIVGLPEAEVRESGDRVRAALLASQFKFPQCRITINLAPANFPKEGARYDLPIALGILLASGQLKKSEKLQKFEFAGELALNGAMRSCGGALPMVISAHKSERTFVLPPDDAATGTLAGYGVLQARTLAEVCAFLNDEQQLEEATPPPPPTPTTSALCMSDVKGQIKVKRALKIAAAGGHSVLMMGPPGSGKSMMAKRFVNLMPPLTENEALESAAVCSLATATFDPQTWRVRPFRSPHHTSSAVALTGGGSKPRPGEISLAHHGVLFLDELPEFQRSVLEALREPLENGVVTISRAAQQAEFPARFQLIAAMNPCPCGYEGHPHKECCCTPTQVYRYRAKISGPILDRIDLHIEVPSINEEDLKAITNTADAAADAANAAATTQAICEHTTATRAYQLARQNRLNADLSTADIDTYCTPNEAGTAMIKNAMQKLNLSARAYHRILKVARTIADLAQEDEITAQHIGEAIQYRRITWNAPT